MLIGSFVDQLKRLAYLRVAHCTQPAAFSGAEGLNPASKHLHEKQLSHPREHRSLAGAPERRLNHHVLQNRLEGIVICRELQVQGCWKQLQHAAAPGA